MSPEINILPYNSINFLPTALRVLLTEMEISDEQIDQELTAFLACNMA